MKIRFTVFAVAVTLGVGLSVSEAETPSTDPLAEVNGETVIVDDVDRALGVKLTKLHEQIYTLKREQLDAMIAERLLA